MKRVLFALLFASLAWSTAPQLFSLARRALSLRPKPYGARRAEVNGELYSSAEAINRLLPRSEPLALVSAGNDSYAIFASYYLYPRRTRIYGNFDIYRIDAVNPKRPKTIVLADEKLTIVTYEEVRDAKLRHARVVHAPPRAPARARFNIPLAASVDGVPPDSWVTEADFANDTNERAMVKMTLHPFERIKTISIPPRGTASFYDLVYQMFRHMDTGWIEVESTQPLRTSIWFVNRGREQFAPIPLIDATPRAGSFACPIPDCKIWFLNLGRSETVAKWSGGDVTLKPNDLKWLPFNGTATVDGANVFAFATTKDARFLWPEGVP